MITGGTMEIKRFLDKVASNTPTPGGGSVSALSGALSASLIAMVAGLSSKKDQEMRKEMGAIKRKALAIQRRLLRAIDEDARSFDQVIKAYRLPRTTEKEQLRRSKVIEQAYKNATIIPQLVCRQSISLLEHARVLILKGNPNAVSDTGVAAFLADASLAGGLLNIGINLVPVKDQDFLKRMRSSMFAWAKERNRIMAEILKALTKVG